MHKTGQKRAIEKIPKENGDLIDNKVVDKVTKFSRISPQNNSETVTNEVENTERKTYISRKKTANNHKLRLK